MNSVEYNYPFVPNMAVQLIILIITQWPLWKYFFLWQTHDVLLRYLFSIPWAIAYFLNPLLSRHGNQSPIREIRAIEKTNINLISSANTTIVPRIPDYVSGIPISVTHYWRANTASKQAIKIKHYKSFRQHHVFLQQQQQQKNCRSLFPDIRLISEYEDIKFFYNALMNIFSWFKVFQSQRSHTFLSYWW